MVPAIGGLWTTVQLQRFTVAAFVGASSLLADLGITAASAGLLAAVYFPAYGAIQVPSGILADQGRPKRNLFWAGLLLTGSVVAFSFSSTIELAIATRAAIGLSSGFFWLSSLKIFALVSSRSYSTSVGMLVAMGNFGGIAGLAGLPVLLAAFHWRLVSLLSALPVAVATLALLLIAEAPEGGPQAARSHILHQLSAGLRDGLRAVRLLLWDPKLWVIFLPAMMWSGAHFGLLSWLARYAHDALGVSKAATGILPSLIPLGLMVGAYGSGRVYGRWRHLGRWLFYGSSVIYCALLLIALAGRQMAASPLVFYALVLALGLVFGSYFLSFSLIADTVPPALLGTASGVLNGLSFLPPFFLPWAMGYAMDLVDRPAVSDWTYSGAAYEVAFSLNAVGLLASLVAAWLIHSRGTKAKGR